MQGLSRSLKPQAAVGERAVDKAHQLRLRGYVPPPASLDWMDIDPKASLGSGDRFMFALLFVWWRGQTRATISRHPAMTRLSQSVPAQPSVGVRIVSSNCWGSRYVQQQAALRSAPFNTPFVGIFFYAPCFVTLLADFETYMSTPLAAAGPTTSRYGVCEYPVATW